MSDARATFDVVGYLGLSTQLDDDDVGGGELATAVVGRRQNVDDDDDDEAAARRSTTPNDVDFTRVSCHTERSVRRRAIQYISPTIREQSVHRCHVEVQEYGRFADTYNCIKTAFHDTDNLADILVRIARMSARMSRILNDTPTQCDSSNARKSSATALRNKKHLKNVGTIRHCEPPHADVHSNNNDDDNDNA